MKKIILFFSIILMITGCSEKIIIPQKTGMPLQNNNIKNVANKKYISFDEKRELRRVNIFASKMFTKLEKNIKINNNQNNSDIFDSIYNNK
jgi:hypothetical protein